MDADTIAITLTHEWPTVRVITHTTGRPTRHETVQARLLDCKACYEAGRGMINHLDGSPCVARPTSDGAF